MMDADDRRTLALLGVRAFSIVLAAIVAAGTAGAVYRVFIVISGV